MRRIVLWSLTCLCIATAVSAASAFFADEKGDSKPIRIAIFNFECVEGVDAKPQALTDFVTTALATIDNVELVDREQLAKVADEQKIALSSIDTNSAIKVGRFLSAQYVLVGRASKIGTNNHLVVKVIDTETTKQTIVSAKAPTEDGVNKLLEKLETSLTEKVGKLGGSKEDDGAAKREELKKRFKPFVGKTFLVEVKEEHVNRPLRDPAAQMAIAKHLRELGLTVIVPEKPVVGWKEHLLETGKYGDKPVDYLIQGDGISANAGQIQGLISCRARVELQAVPVPGREVAASDKGVGAAIDLVEALGAKSALEEAGVQSADATLTLLLKNKGDKDKSRKED